MGVYVTYRQHTGKIHSATDWDPTTYSGIRIFDDTQELEALRYANAHGLRVVKMVSGEDLDEVVKVMHTIKTLTNQEG